MVTIAVLNAVGDGLVRVDTGMYGVQIWVRSSRRGAGKNCLVCGKDLTGLLSYRPTGSPPNRGWRICMEDFQVGKVYTNVDVDKFAEGSLELPMMAV